jgi:hypothetical protein
MHAEITTIRDPELCKIVKKELVLTNLHKHGLKSMNQNNLVFKIVLLQPKIY